MRSSMEGEEGEEENQEGFLQRLFSAHNDKFGLIMRDPAKYRFQVLLSEVECRSSGKPQLKRHSYRADEEYFYPASAIKLVAVVATVEKLKLLRSSQGRDLPLGTPLSFLPLLRGVEEDRNDPTNSDNHKISLAHEIRKLFLVSDNQAYNRLYAFVGHRILNEIMWNKGLMSTRVHHRLSLSLSPRLNRFCEPVEICMEDGSYILPPKQSELWFPNDTLVPGFLVGEAHINSDRELVKEPMDFSKKNYISLKDLQDLLVKLVRPDVELGTPSLNIDEGVRLMLMEAMSQYPGSSSNPRYDRVAYPDDYCKFLLPGVARVRSKGAIRIYNKVGRAYGFSVDNAYVCDVETGRSFFLAAVLYTNENGIVNDDVYEYKEIADKVMADLGEVVARAVWKTPIPATNTSCPFDQIPSSMWNGSFIPIRAQNQHLGLVPQPSPSEMNPKDDLQSGFTCTCHRHNPPVSADREEESQLQTVLAFPRTNRHPNAREDEIRACYRFFVDE